MNHKRISYVIGKSSYTKKIDIEDRENIQINEENVYLVQAEDGTFDLYINGEYCSTITEVDLIRSSSDIMEVRKEN